MQLMQCDCRSCCSRPAISILLLFIFPPLPAITITITNNITIIKGSAAVHNAAALAALQKASNSCRHRRRFPAFYLNTTTITRPFALECWTHCAPQCRRATVTWHTPANPVSWRPTCRTFFGSSWYYLNHVTIISTTRLPMTHARALALQSSFYRQFRLSEYFRSFSFLYSRNRI